MRQIGSGNIGATNVLRTGHKGLAAATLALDLLKGTVAVLLVYEIAKRFVAFDAYQLSYVAGLGAMLGHIFPVWLRFAGGKGVATFIGVLLGLYFPAAVVFCLVWAAVAAGNALFLAGGAVGHRRRRALLPGVRAGRPAVHRPHGRPDLLQASRQYSPPARRRGEQDRCQVVSPRSAP